MRKTLFRRMLAMTATAGLATALAACGPDDAPQNRIGAPLLSQAALQTGWSMDDLAAVDPAFIQADAGPLPRALPMRPSYDGDYDLAPAYDYGPEPYYDDGYYEDDAGADDYQWLALAAALTGMLGSAPPDYGFGYDGVRPWAWETGDRYLRYAEPIYGGYRYYYYQPDAYTPFLVSDPYYSYGYRGDRLVTVYDRWGRVLDAGRAARQRQAARDYFVRARELYQAGHRQPRTGVAAPLWERQRDEIAREQQRWAEARQKRPAWQKWDAGHQPKLHREWGNEALVRRAAERSYAGWQKADYKTPAPKLYGPQQRKAQLQKVADIRRDDRQDLRRREQRSERGRDVVLAPSPVPQRVTGQQQAQVREQREQRKAAQQQRSHRAQQAAHQRQTEAKATEQAQGRQHVQRLAAEQRQKAEHQQAQRQAERNRAAQQQRQAERAQAAQHERQAQRRQAAQRERQAQRAEAAQRQQAAHAQQQRQAEQARQARAAKQQQQAQQARAAKQQQAQQAQAARQQQRSAGQAQATSGGGSHGRGHGKGHDRG